MREPPDWYFSLWMVALGLLLSGVAFRLLGFDPRSTAAYALAGGVVALAGWHLVNWLNERAWRRSIERSQWRNERDSSE